MDWLAGLFAFVILTGFLAILAFSVPSPDLVAVIGLTVLLVAVDYIRSTFGRR